MSVSFSFKIPQAYRIIALLYALLLSPGACGDGLSLSLLRLIGHQTRFERRVFTVKPLHAKRPVRVMDPSPCVAIA